MGHGQVMLEGICVDACHVKVMLVVVGSFTGLGWVWRGKRWGASENHRPAALSDIQHYLPPLQKSVHWERWQISWERWRPSTEQRQPRVELRSWYKRTLSSADLRSHNTIGGHTNRSREVAVRRRESDCHCIRRIKKVFVTLPAILPIAVNKSERPQCQGAFLRNFHPVNIT